MPKRIFALTGLAAYLLYAAAPGWALPPPRPGLVDPLTQRYRTTGARVLVFPKEVRQYRRPTPLKGKFPLAPGRASVAAGGRPLAVDTQVQSVIRPFVLLVDFADRPASASPNIASTAIDTLLFGNGASDLSVRNYWNEVSYGNFTIQRPSAAVPANPDVIGWLRAGGTAPGGFPSTITSSSQVADANVPNVRQLLADAVASLSAQGFDFSPYVRSSDGTFNAVILVHSGTGQEDSGLAGIDPYSHTAPVSPIATAAGNIVDYAIVPAKQYFTDPTPADPATGIDPDPADDPRIGVGVLVHEMGHLFGLPDLYPTTTAGQVVTDNVFSGAGVFDLMAYGMWGNNLLQGPAIPAHLSAWSKIFLGWLTPAEVSNSNPRSLRPVEIFPEVDLIYSNTRSGDPTQYLLLENRQQTSSLGSWLFDKIGTAGVLIWQIDEDVINNHFTVVNGIPFTNEVNSNPAFRGVYVKEADGVPHMGLPIPPGNPNDQAAFFGQQADLFLSAGQVFDRTNPSATVNSGPIVDNTFTNHPVDFGIQVSIFAFARSLLTNVMDFVIDIAGGGTSVPSWKTFNVASTTPKYAEPMRSDDILSLAFDSGNNVWMGSRDRGIFRFLGSNFDILSTLDGLPSGASTEVAPIRAMASENQSGSVWVGTDRGLFKMRDSGAGFRVLSSYTENPPPAGRPVPVGNRILPPGTGNIGAIAVRGGFTSGTKPIDLKYAATPVGVIRLNDLDLDSEAVDPVSVILRTGATATALALDDNGNATAADDILWVGDAAGNVYRSRLPGADGGPATADPTFDAQFKLMFTLTGAQVTSLSVDKKGLLWIGTDRFGLQVFDIGETLNPAAANLRDPFDFDDDGDTTATLNPPYLNVSRGLASNHVTGIAFQSTSDPDAVAWVTHQEFGGSPGGASRFNANAANDNATFADERLTVFRPDPAVPLPENQVTGPASTSLSTVAADTAGNVWFGTTAPAAAGASRFGNAGIVSLDKSNYVNTSAVATITLQDDGRNTSDIVVDTADVRVTSASDTTGIRHLALTETGPNTGIFVGKFGFTAGSTDETVSPPLLSVANGNAITVTYVDFDPPGVRTASATWKSVYPFSDSLFIEDFRCFIATAAYGSGMAPEVRTLRAFRDRVLLAVPLGDAVVGLYYRLSPPLAGFIGHRPALKFVARRLIAPVVMAASVAVGTAAGEAAVVLLLLFGIPAGGFLLRRRSGGPTRK